MAIFKKKTKKESVVMAQAPEEAETPGEIKHNEDITTPKEKPELEYREIPVCLSQAQVNNMFIENNIMLKQIIAEID